MKSFSCFYSIAVAIIILSAAKSLTAGECRILWIHPEQAPLSIAKGYGAGKGTIDRMEAFFAEQMKDCRHDYESGNYERIMWMIRKKNAACSVPLYITPEREEFIAFSVPYQIVLSNALIVSGTSRVKLASFLNRDGQIDLDALLDRGFRVGIAKGRVYRGIIDRTIAKYRNTPSIVEHDGPEEMIGSLISMMAGGRIDALVAYPMEAQYVANGMKIEVYSLPVAGMDDFGLTSVGCSKTKEGMEIIQKLNTIILKHRTTPEFMSFTEQWLDPAALERHRTFTRQAFGR